jgi:ATP-dependent 26S proteasome regulatory subunit
MQTSLNENLAKLPISEQSKISKKKRIGPLIEKNDSLYKLAKILILDHAEENSRSMVWMHTKDVEELYKKIDTKKSYVRIANRAYKIGLKDIQEGSICISNKLKSEIKSNLTTEMGKDSVILQPFSLVGHEYELNNITLKIEFHGAFDKPACYDHEDLESRCKKLLSQRIINLHELLLLDSENEQITLFVKSIGLIPTRAEKFKGSFGQVTKKTQIRFENANSDTITFITQKKDDFIEHCSFSVRIKESPKNPFRFPLCENGESYLVPHNLFLKTLHHAYDHERLFEGFKGKIIVNNQPFKFTINTIKGAAIPPIPFGCRRAMIFTESSQVSLSCSNSEVIFVGKKRREANECYMRVVEIIEIPKNPKTHQWLTPWINVSELKNQLKNIHFLAVGQRINVVLSTGSFVMKLEDAGSFIDDSFLIAEEEKDFKSLWYFNQDTNFTLSVSHSLNVKIVNSQEPLPIECIDLEVLHHRDIVSKNDDKNEVLELELEEAIKQEAPTHIVKGQAIQVIIRGEAYLITVKKMQFHKKITVLDDTHLGVLKLNSVCNFFSNKMYPVSIVAKQKALDQETILTSLKKMKLGGLQSQLEELVRRVVIFQDPDLKSTAESFGLKPLRGCIFYGPHGTGKTSLARAFGNIIGCDNIQLISSTELINKYVGETEKNIRKIFEPAQKMQQKFGKNSPLNLIIIDEIDAIAPQRSEGNDSWTNTMVNQLLSCIDGLTELNNILVIGTTNRFDALDPAVIRAGRLEFHLEIGLPDIAGRLEIFQIYTENLKAAKKLSFDINLKVLAKNTKGFSGADIEGVVRTASSYPLARLFRNKKASALDKAIMEQLTQQDLLKAIKDVSKTKGAPDDKVADGMYI